MARRRLGTHGGTLVLDSDGLSKLAGGDPATHALVAQARARHGGVATSAVTLAEVLRGSPLDAGVHRVLAAVEVVPVTAALGRMAGELLGRAGLTGHRHALDAVVAATALSAARPGLVVTTDPSDLGRLVEEPDCPRERRVGVAKV